MEPLAALAILRALADGRDPYSREPLPAHGPYQHADTVRALYFALGAIEGQLTHHPLAVSAAVPAAVPTANVAAPPASRRKAPPGNTGKPWARADDERLLSAFDCGEPITALAAAHARSKVAIEARLARFGRLPMPSGLRSPVRAATVAAIATPEVAQ